MLLYPFDSKPTKKKRNTDPKGYVTVRDFHKGDFIRLTGKKGTKAYIRGEYDRELKKYHLVDCDDVYGNGRYVKGDTPANDDFMY